MAALKCSVRSSQMISDGRFPFRETLVGAGVVLRVWKSPRPIGSPRASYSACAGKGYRISQGAGVADLDAIRQMLPQTSRRAGKWHLYQDIDSHQRAGAAPCWPEHAVKPLVWYQ